MGYSGIGLLTGFPSMALEKSADAGGRRWYRGNLHMHSYWSDGRAFPEQAVAIYKKLGYDFIGLSDHNIFATDRECWRSVEEKEGGWPPQITTPIFEEYCRSFGDEVETRRNGDKTEVRLKTFDEMRARFEEPEKFLLMPAVEITQLLEGINVHLNYFNLPDTLPSLKGGPLSRHIKEENLTVGKLIARNVAEVDQLATKLGQPTLLMLNHPQWVYLDINPQSMIDNPRLRFFEVCNGGSAFAPHPEASKVDNESVWDTVNAFRCLKNEPLLFGVGTDDTHHYINRTSTQRMADSWIMVRSQSLTPEALLQAMDAGDFYATTGVALDEVNFDARSRTLRVKANAQPGVNYRIRFITTKRDFDQRVRTVSAEAEKKRPARKIPVYSDDIGRCALTVEGTEGAYRMADDDLYVRARIESDVALDFHPHFHPAIQLAWTQPCK